MQVPVSQDDMGPYSCLGRFHSIQCSQSIKITLYTGRPLSVGGDIHLNERRVVTKANRVRKLRGGSAERTGWEREIIVDRLHTERHPGVWFSGGLESST